MHRALFLLAFPLFAMDPPSELLPFGSGSVLVYRSHPLAQKNEKIKHALIVIHGAGRNADHYYLSGAAGAFLTGQLETTLVASPRFAITADKRAPTEIAFEDWRGGGGSENTSYHLIDALLLRLADKKLFPNLQTIAVIGHSAGGQFLSRYAAASRVDPAVPVTYVISNPSSYLYFDTSRPAPNAECKNFNTWKYGLEGKAGYASNMPNDNLLANLVRRKVVYLLGELDVTPQFSFDGSCAAMTQGPSRFARGISYHTYINGKYKAAHQLVKVPNCGHNGRCMIVADEARPVLFPEPVR